MKPGFHGLPPRRPFAGGKAERGIQRASPGWRFHAGRRQATVPLITYLDDGRRSDGKVLTTLTLIREAASGEFDNRGPHHQGFWELRSGKRRSFWA